MANLSEFLKGIKHTCWRGCPDCIVRGGAGGHLHTRDEFCPRCTGEKVLRRVQRWLNGKAAAATGTSFAPLVNLETEFIEALEAAGMDMTIQMISPDVAQRPGGGK